MDCLIGIKAPVAELGSVLIGQKEFNMKRDTMLVHLDIDSTPAPMIDFALDLADKLEMDVIGFSAAQPGLLIPGDIDGSASIEAMKLETKEIEARLKLLEETFSKATQGARFASWRSEVGGPTQALLTQARAAGIVVTSTPSADLLPDFQRTVDPGTLVLAAGKPVLFAMGGLSHLTGKNIVVAWKDTRESRRAVADAMPFLRRAENVVVTIIEESSLADARRSAEDVANYLVKLGVRARSEVIEVSSSQTADALVEAARTFDADLLVSGGYGHSRVREWVFGGVTRSLLNNSSINRLMSN